MVYAEDIYLLAMNANVDKLKHTDKDRRRIINSFKYVYGTDRLTVYPIHNVTRRKYNQAMKLLKQVVKKRDHLIIYFSGHGTTIPDSGGDEADGYDEAFVGYSPDGRMHRNQAILDDMLAKDIREINPKKLTVILDTCYSGGMRKTFTTNNMTAKFIPNPLLRKGALGKRLKTKSSLFHEGSKGMVDGFKGVLYAASQERQLAYEYNKANLKGGIFTQNFANALRYTKNLSKAFNIAKRNVEKYTKRKQIPQKYYY